MNAVLFRASSGRSLFLWALIFVAASLSTLAQGSIVFTNRAVLIHAGSAWSYWNRESAPAAEWKSPDFLGADWLRGNAQLGYGDGDEATVTRNTGAPHPLAAYFRRTFTLSENPTALTLRLLRDDGAVVYINGAEVLRDNMPEGVISHNSTSRETTGSDTENQFRTFTVSTASLHLGTNTIAVEVHQANAASTDLSFDLELSTGSVVVPSLPVVSIRTTQGNTSEPLPNALVAPGEFVISRVDPSSEFPLTVFLAYSGTASAADYQPLPMNVTFPPGSNSVSIRVLPKSDELVEGTEVLVARLLAVPIDTTGMPSTSRGYLIDWEHSRAEVRIADEDKPTPVLPVVSLETVVAQTMEPSPLTRVQPGQFRLRRTGTTESELNVYLAVRGSAIPDLDYDRLPQFVKFEAGRSETDLFVAPIDDSLVEGTETVETALEYPANMDLALTYSIHETANKGTVRILDSDLTGSATLRITEPSQDSAFPLGQPIQISAVAIDPAGYIDRVEFYAGGSLIGVSEIDFIVAPEPGTPITHTIEWSNPPAGEHWIGASAKDSKGDTLVSPRVRIFVGNVPDRVLVSVTTTDPEATEFPPYVDAIDPASFEVSRTGSTNIELVVFYSLHGTARNGVDYTALPGTVIIPAGARSATIHILPISDLLDVVEPMETVGIRLEPSPDARPIPMYEVARGQSTAAAVIHEQNSAAAGLAFASPDDQERFQINQTVNFLVAAYHPTLDLTRVEFLVDGQRIGILEVVVPPDEPGGVVFHRLEWIAAPAGQHTLTARAVLPSGVILSHSITIFVGESNLPTVGVRFVMDDTTQPWPDADYAPGSFYFTRTGPTNEALSVYFAVGGTATPGVDYLRLPESIVVAAGQSSAYLKVDAIDDQRFEGEETVEVTLKLPPIATAELSSGKYVIDERWRSASLRILDNDDPVGTARIEITNPRDGDRFPVGVPIPVEAVAVDPNGYIPRVEFYAGDRLIGVSEIVFIRAPDPGTPIHHSIIWSNAPAGEHILTARGKDSFGHIVVSNPVHISVGGQMPDRVVLNVEAVDPEAAEWEADGTTDRAVFVIRRQGGPTNVAVTVYYHLSGTAENGVDYELLSGIAMMRAGQLALELVVRPIPDKALEGAESVILNLREPPCARIFPTPSECYLLGSSSNARAVIRDGSVGANLPPNAAVTQPHDGAVFEQGRPIEIRVGGADRDGTIVQLDLIVDDRLVWRTNQNSFTFVWSNAPAGEHVLRARVVDNGGAQGESRTVRILVREPTNASFVRRELPAGYVSGTPFTVRLFATPFLESRVWGAEDRPPQGWTVREISDGGVFDAATGKVKFGHFTDIRSRTLSYQVTPPPGAAGQFEFEGTSSVDGRSYRISGDQIINDGTQEYHPADTDKNRRIILVELTAYAAAWKVGPTSQPTAAGIPLSYVTRAAQIWRRGETYHYVSTNPAPQCWVPDFEPIRALAAIASTAVRSTGPSIAPESPVDVTIAVQPVTGIGAFAVEEVVPAGWLVANVSDDGTFDAATRTIRWGLFLDGLGRSLRYTLVPPIGVTSIAELTGTASFDGELQPVTGSSQITAVEESSQLWMPSCIRRGDGAVLLKLAGAPRQVCVLEGSSDLNTWTEVSVVFLPDGELDFLDLSAASTARWFYRLRGQ